MWVWMMWEHWGLWSKRGGMKRWIWCWWRENKGIIICCNRSWRRGNWWRCWRRRIMFWIWGEDMMWWQNWTRWKKIFLIWTRIKYIFFTFNSTKFPSLSWRWLIWEYTIWHINNKFLLTSYNYWFLLLINEIIDYYWSIFSKKKEKKRKSLRWFSKLFSWSLSLFSFDVGFFLNGRVSSANGLSSELFRIKSSIASSKSWLLLVPELLFTFKIWIFEFYAGKKKKERKKERKKEN